MTRRRLRLLLGLVALFLLDALLVEPRLALVRVDVREPLGVAPFRIVHLSDLHVPSAAPLYARVLRRVRDAEPDLVVVSGDFVDDEQREVSSTVRNADRAAAFLAQLRRIAPIAGVQGHSEYLGPVIARLARAGVRLLSNEGVRVGPSGSILLLGLNQQVGTDALVGVHRDRFEPTRRQGQVGFGYERTGKRRNVYASWDPAPHSLGDAGGAMAWSGYDTTVETWIDRPATGTGIAVHSRYALGEDRMIRFGRGPTDEDPHGPFAFSVLGSEPTAAAPETRVDPEPGRWYALRVRTEVLPDRVRAQGKAWPAGTPEPAEWQAWIEDASPLRVAAGTVALTAWGGGTVLYRNLKVTSLDGRVLLDAPLTERDGPVGFRSGCRGTRLEMALARSPAMPAGTPRIVLSHVPDPALEASRHGLDLVLAGHTHGGQVRIPGLGAITTRDLLGRAYDRGVFEFASASPRGWTTLYVNAGVGTSVFPIRFWDPPTFGVIDLGPAAASER